MNRRDLFVFLVLELFAIAWAAAMFKWIESRLFAGALAGGYFVISAAYITWRVSRWEDRWRSACFYPLLLHLFGVSLPMVISRFLQANQVFENVQIWGLSGPEFHRLSGWVFSALIAGTVVDIVRASLKPRPLS